jgi:hypothetical protein
MILLRSTKTKKGLPIEISHKDYDITGKILGDEFFNFLVDIDMPSELRVLQAHERGIGPLACYIVRGKHPRTINPHPGDMKRTV